MQNENIVPDRTESRRLRESSDQLIEAFILMLRPMADVGAHPVHLLACDPPGPGDVIDPVLSVGSQVSLTQGRWHWNLSQLVQERPLNGRGPGIAPMLGG